MSSCWKTIPTKPDIISIITAFDVHVDHLAPLCRRISPGFRRGGQRLAPLSARHGAPGLQTAFLCNPRSHSQTSFMCKSPSRPYCLPPPPPPAPPRPSLMRLQILAESSNNVMVRAPDIFIEQGAHQDEVNGFVFQFSQLQHANLH